MSTILSSSLRSNLNSAKLLSDQLEKTQERVATGRKVNSASDDAYAYFSEANMRKTANKLEGVFSEMDTGTKTIDAAVAALNGISDLADRAESLVRAALESSDMSEREGLRAQVSDLMTSMQQMAENAGYRGVNLLGDSTNTLSMDLNADGSETLDIAAATGADDAFTDLSGASFGFDVSAIGTATANVSASDSFTTASHASLTGASTLDTLGYADGDSLSLTDGTNTYTFTIGTAATTSIDDVIAGVDGDGNFTMSVNADNTITYAAAAGGDFTVSETIAGASTTVSLVNGATGVAAQSESVAVGYFGSDATLNDLLSTLDSFRTTMQAKEGSLANYQVIADAHQALTEKMISLLEENADNLVVADVEEESVNLNVLQTRQQLAMISISLATQQEQNVMRLF